MKSDYSRDIFKQLEETMKRLDKMESTLENTKIKHKIGLCLMLKDRLSNGIMTES